jgi:hypothetical protein
MGGVRVAAFARDGAVASAFALDLVFLGFFGVFLSTRDIFLRFFEFEIVAARSSLVEGLKLSL